MDNSKNIYSNGNGGIYSSFEGHALIYIQGYGLMNLQGYSVSCVFSDFTTGAFIYKSLVLKEKTTCDVNDYHCMYWTTSYQFSDTQIACYTPKIPEADRASLFTAATGSPRMKISLEVTVNSVVTSLTCASPNDCAVVYQAQYTPSLITFTPAHFYIGQMLNIRLIPLAGNIYTLMAVQIGRNNCDYTEPTNNSNGWGDMVLSCATSDSYATEEITGFNISFMTGTVVVLPFFNKDDVDPTLADNTSKFYFKAFPRIDSATKTGLRLGGQQITISGAGFVPTKTRVFINTDECTTNLVVTLNSITCQSPVSTIDFTSTSNIYLGSKGLRWRVYKLTSSSIAALNALPGFPDTTTTITRDDILLETMTPNTFTNLYGQYLTGYFKAPYSGAYTFWLTSDDSSQVYLSTDSTAANKQLIVSLNGWNNYMDWFTNQYKSAPITLVKDSLYYFEAKHVQGYGADHFGLGVEISTTGIDTTKLAQPLPNLMSKILNISITPKVSRDIYELVINSMTANIYTMTCKTTDGTSTKTLKFDPTKMAAQILSSLASITGEGQLLVRKLGYNNLSQYYLGAGEAFDDASYTTTLSFSNMYVNLSGVASATSVPITTVSDGTKAGFVFLVMIDRMASQRTYDWENNCYFTTSTTPIIQINKKQSVSPQMTGKFFLKITDPALSAPAITQSIDITTISVSGILNILNSISTLTNKIQVFYAALNTEVVNIYVRLDNSINSVIQFNAPALLGGLNNTPITAVTDYTSPDTDLFFLPIPADFLYVQNPLPQVRVVSNGFEAACLAGNCAYTYIDPASLVTVTAATFEPSSNAVTITIDNPLPANYTPTINIGPSLCGQPINYNSTTKIFSCTLTNPIVAGSFIPELKTQYGSLKGTSSLVNVTIPLAITSISPTTVLQTGGATVTITGTGFPITMDVNLSVNAGNAVCVIQTVTNTQITCIAGVKVNTNALVVTYNSITATSTGSQFSYTVPTSTPPAIQTVTPNSVAPGEKQFIEIAFDKDITSYIANLSTITVQLVHTTVANYIILMKPKEITTTNLKVKFGGAMVGQYNLYVKFDDSTTAIGNPTFTSGFSIDSITPNIGSINGGTTLTLTGTNFLSTQMNQIVFIGKTQCNYITNSSTSITCKTQAANSSTDTDVNQSVAVEQMIQYDSACSVNSGNGCIFEYSTAKTAIINNIQSDQSDFIFALNDNIKINGSNFNFANTLTSLTFDWGIVTITGGDYSTQLIGTVSTISSFGLKPFNFYNDYGVATQTPTGTSVIAGKSTVFIILKKPVPVITSINPTPISENGGIFSLFTTITDFTTYLDANSKLLNSITICGKSCTVLKTNLLTNANNNIQCYINIKISQSSFTTCAIVLSYYDLNIPLPNTNTVSSITTNNYSFNSIVVTSNTAPALRITVTLSTNKIDMANLRLIVDYRYVYPATTPATIVNSKAVYIIDIPNGLPAGSWTCYLHEDSLGFILPPSALQIKNSSNLATSKFMLNVPLVLTPIASATSVDSSYYGGLQVQIDGTNLNKLISNVDTDTVITTVGANFQNVYVCGVKAKILEFKSTYIKFITPTILNYSIFSNTNIINNNQFDLLSDLSNLVQLYSDTTTASSYVNLFDNNPFTSMNTVLSTTTFTYIGVSIASSVNSNFKILLKKVKVFVGQSSRPGDFNTGWIEGSTNGSTWTKIANIPSNLPFLWYTINIDFSAVNLTGSNVLFSYVRFIPNSNASSIAEIRFIGNVVFDTTQSLTSCGVTVTDNFNSVTVTNLNINYNIAKTYTLSAVTPNNGSSVGGNTVIFTLANTNTLTGSETISVKVFGNPITTAVVIDNTVTPNTISVTMISRSNVNYDSKVPLEIKINTIGVVYCGSLYYRYLDRWSDSNTWGGEYIPANGETAYILNTDVLLDVPGINLNTLVVENGSLIVEDTRDYKISAWNILVKSGKFIVGTEDSPFVHNFELTMKSSKSDPTLPIFGNKVLAVLEGQLELHGIVRSPIFTFITTTAQVGDSTITILGPVDWKVGESIVIASSSLQPTQAEPRIIVALSGCGTTSCVITLDNSLKYLHYGVIETYGTDTFDMRAEVALLTRNVVIQGDENSKLQQYGCHIMLTALEMNMNTDTNVVTSGKLSYIEVRYSGQAFQLGRYPIHFHMMGDVNGSYVRGCSIHHTFNRALTIHAVSNFLVEKNVAYNVMGHTFFIEDAVETNNIIRYNIGINTKSSSSLLNTDHHPATFWITNPSNFFEGNHACGSANYGFWMDLPLSPTGMNLGVKGCPRENPLGSFKDNVSHSNGQYGIRIFPEFNPKNKPCLPVDGVNVVTVQAFLTNNTAYRNAERGVMNEAIGNLVFDKYKVADCVVSGMEISVILPFTSGIATIQNSIIVGRSKNPIEDSPYQTYGLITPRSDQLLVNGVKFYSFGTAGSALFSSCSRCEVSGASTDSGARTNFFKNIQSDGSEVMRVKWAQPRRDIFRDLDGTLTQSVTPAWVTPYYPHNLSKECVRTTKFDDGIICNDSIQIRRVAFSSAQPSNIFSGQPMKVMRINGNLETVTFTTTIDTTQVSSLPFKEKTNPNNGWAIPFVTGYNYLLSFGVLGLDFSSLAIERSVMWASTDKPINLALNYTSRRDQFNITGVDNNSKVYVVSNTTDLVGLNTLSPTPTATTPYGTFYNNLKSRYLYMGINGYNPNNFTNNLLSVTAIQCYNNDCGVLPPTGTTPEFIIRKWSDATNWPNGIVPADGSSQIIKQEWTMLLDVSTANLQLLTIYGKLYFDPTADGLELKANNILNYGVLEIGTNTTAFTKTAKLTLTGNKFSPNIALTNFVQTPNKAFLNIGDLHIFGQDRSPYNAKLMQTAKKGSDSFKVGPSLKWSTGDEILIATTSFNNNETERFTVTSYSTTTGDLSINGILKYDHYGGVSATKFADSPLNPPIDLDERADVYMITRNVKISGSDEGWGCNIFTTKLQTIEFLYYGRTNLNHAEVTNCGQLDTKFAAIHFEQHNTVRSISTLTGLSLHDNNYSGINIVNSIQVFLQSIVEFQQKKYGVYVSNSNNITITDVNVVQMQNRTFPGQLAINKLTDINACFYICPDSTCKDVYTTNSTCAGSDFFAFYMDATDCTKDFTKSPAAYNRAYSSLIGYLIVNAQNRACMKFGNAISYRNKMGYNSNTPSDLAIHENILSSNDLNGITVIQAGNALTRKQVRKALMIGQNLDNPLCITTDLCPMNICKQYGFIMSTTAVSGVSTPVISESFPLYNPMSDAKSGSFFDGFNMTFVNYEDQCAFDQYAIKSNERASDFSSIHNINYLTLNRVLEDNFIYFENPIIPSDETSCGSFPCSGPNNVLFKVGSFLQSADTFDSANIKVNPKWSLKANSTATTSATTSATPSSKKYCVPNYNIPQVSSPSNFITNNNPTYSLIDGTSFIILSAFSRLSFCSPVPVWNSLTCLPQKKLGILILENTDAEARTRSIAPVNVIDLDPNEVFNNKLNSFMDHSCEFGYPSFLRTPIFPSIITLDKAYNVTFASTVPKNLKFQLFDYAWDNNLFNFNTYPSSSQKVSGGVVITIQYPAPLTVLIYNKNTGVEIVTKVWKEGENFAELTCGSSKWTPVANTFQFYVSNSPDCVLLLQPTNSVKVSLRMDMTVDSFYSSSDNINMIYKIAAVLGIPPEQLRITNVNKGSTIITAYILESIPTITTTSGGTSASTTAVKLNLDTVLSNLVQKLKDGTINLPAPLLNLNYTMLRTQVDPTSGSTNTTTNTSSVSIDTSIIFTPTVLNNITNTNTTNANFTFPNIIDNLPVNPNPAITVDQNQLTRIYIIVFITVPIGLIIIGIIVGVMVHKCLRMRREKQSIIEMSQRALNLPDQLSKHVNIEGNNIVVSPSNNKFFAPQADVSSI